MIAIKEQICKYNEPFNGTCKLCKQDTMIVSILLTGERGYSKDGTLSLVGDDLCKKCNKRMKALEEL